MNVLLTIALTLISLSVILGTYVLINYYRLYSNCFGCYDIGYVRKNIFNYRNNTVIKPIQMSLYWFRKLNEVYGTYSILQDYDFNVTVGLDNFSSDSYWLYDIRQGFQLVSYSDKDIIIPNNGDAIITIFPYKSTPIS